MLPNPAPRRGLVPNLRRSHLHGRTRLPPSRRHRDRTRRERRRQEPRARRQTRLYEGVSRYPVPLESPMKGFRQVCSAFMVRIYAGSAGRRCRLPIQHPIHVDLRDICAARVPTSADTAARPSGEDSDLQEHSARLQPSWQRRWLAGLHFRRDSQVPFGAEGRPGGHGGSPMAAILRMPAESDGPAGADPVRARGWRINDVPTAAGAPTVAETLSDGPRYRCRIPDSSIVPRL